jgi:hypothetical protein
MSMQPPETTSSVVEQEWARSLRSGPPKWTLGNPRNYIPGEFYGMSGEETRQLRSMRRGTGSSESFNRMCNDCAV